MTDPPCLRLDQTKLYRNLIAYSLTPDHLFAFDKDVACSRLSIKVSSTCSCGRFFEQHPTSIEDTEGERFEVFLQSILTGHCRCLSFDSQSLSVGLQEVDKTFLHVAASLGLCSMVRRFVEEAGCDINDITRVFHFTALSLAVMQTKNDLVQWLCQQPGIDVNIKSKNEKHTPLVDAMLAEKFLLVEIISTADSVDLNAMNFRMETPLIIGIRMNNVRLVRQLLMAGADYSIPAPDGTPPLLMATRAGRDVIQEFVDARVPLDVQDLQGETALTCSIRNRTLDVTNVLLQGGANPNTNPGLPCFVLAASLGLMRTMVYLWEKGENLNRADDRGWTALHFASMRGFTTIARLLLRAGACPDCLVNCDISPIGLSVFYRHHEITEALLAHNCRVTVFDPDLDTPLHYATFNGDTDLVRELLDHGADACSLNGIGATPLFNAAVANNTVVVKILLPHYVGTHLHSKSFGYQYDSWNSKRMLFEEERSVLWISSYKGNTTMISSLLYAGFRAFSEAWIHERDFPETLLSMMDDSVLALLVEHASAPNSLLSLCRCVIRDIFGAGKQRKANQIGAIPRKMKNYIMLRDIDVI